MEPALDNSQLPLANVAMKILKVTSVNEGIQFVCKYIYSYTFRSSRIILILGLHQVVVDFEVHVQEYVSRRDRSAPSSSSRINVPHLYPSNLTNIRELGCISHERSNITHSLYTFRGTYESLVSYDSQLYPFDSLGMYTHVRKNIYIYILHAYLHFMF